MATTWEYLGAAETGTMFTNAKARPQQLLGLQGGPDAEVFN